MAKSEIGGVVTAASGVAKASAKKSISMAKYLAIAAAAKTPSLAASLA
jgi:hypothetical protein